MICLRLSSTNFSWAIFYYFVSNNTKVIVNIRFEILTRIPNAEKSKYSNGFQIQVENIDFKH